MVEFVDRWRRATAAKQIRAIRNIEKRGIYVLRRNEYTYQNTLLGVRAFFQYLSTLSPKGVVYDVGSGNTQAVQELLLLPKLVPENIQLRATGLRANPEEINKYLGMENFTITSAEVLRGIPPESVLGILANYSIAYSASPYLTVDSIDRVLIPGGALKATFKPRWAFSGFYAFTGMRSPHSFANELKKRGYDVATMINKGEPMESVPVSILLAIKPGGPENIEAATLLQTDADNWLKNERTADPATLQERRELVQKTTPIR